MQKSKGFIVILGIIIVAAIVAVIFNQGKVAYSQDLNDVAFCKNCHEMNPQIYTWQISSHNKVACTTCHQDVKRTDFLYKHWKGFFQAPVKNVRFVSNAVCEQCHSSQREITPKRGNIVPHQFHMDKGVDCIDCHGSLSHFNVSQRMLAKGATTQDAANFTPQEAEKYKTTVTVSMATCLKCHNGAKATNQCTACHEKSPKGAVVETGITEQ